MNKKILVCLLLISQSSHANIDKYSNIFNTPKDEISFSTLAEMNYSDDMKKEIIERREQNKTKGYYEKDDPYIKNFLDIVDRAPKELKLYGIHGKYGKYDTYLKYSYKNIPLAFPFNGINAIKQSQIIGYAAISTYVKNNSYYHKEGWTGIRLFFKDEEQNICSYQYEDLKAAHGFLKLNQEDVKYTVNGKPSYYYVQGSSKYGFRYVINWYEKGKSHNLECDTKKFDHSLMSNMIILANNIDQYMKGN